MPRRSLPRELLTDEESDALLAQCDSSPKGLRDRALILLLEGTGARVSEVLALEPRDVDWEARTVFIRAGHGGHERFVPAAPEALVAVRKWLSARAELGIDNDAPVCGSLRGSPLRAPSARRLLANLGRQAGIRKRVHSMGLRYRFVTRLVRHGAVITSVAHVLGHQSVATTYETLRELGLNHALDDVQHALDTQKDRFADPPQNTVPALPEPPLARTATATRSKTQPRKARGGR
jgi:site-specific recombinase XerD